MQFFRRGFSPSFRQAFLNKDPFPWRRRIDFGLILTVLALLAFGLVVLKSATLSYGTDAQVKRQSIATILGLLSMGIFTAIDYRLWKRLAIPIYILCILLLVATLVFGHGETTWGSRSWLRVGPLNFQPAEFVKVGLILSLSTLFERLGEINTVKNFLIAAGASLVPVILIGLQPDFGTALVFVFFIAWMFFFANLSWRVILSALGAALLAIPLSYPFLADYQKKRILDFFNPEANTSGSGYQYYESRIAIGSGRITGKGLFQGTQTQYNFIPTKSTDSIFPVLVEELGFLGGFALLLLYLFLLYRLIEIGRASKDKMGQLMSVGIASMILFHIWENVGMNLGLMPITGIPLPFFSYGGTFQIVILSCIGLVMSLRFHRQP